MNSINLLPWREWRRERARRAFFVHLGLSGAAAIAVVLALGWQLDRESVRMDRRNDYLRERIGDLDRRIADIEKLTDQTERVLSRLEAARGLHGNRQTMVRTLDALARTLADGVHYTSVSLTDGLFAASGAAASNDRVSSLMRNLEHSPWFAEPSLKSISESRDSPHYGGRASQFELTFRRAGTESERPRPQRLPDARDAGSAGARSQEHG